MITPELTQISMNSVDMQSAPVPSEASAPVASISHFYSGFEASRI